MKTFVLTKQAALDVESIWDYIADNSIDAAAQLPDLEAMRSRILSGLKLGRQAPQYKTAALALDRLIAQLLSQ